VSSVRACVAERGGSLSSGAKSTRHQGTMAGHGTSMLEGGGGEGAREERQVEDLEDAKTCWHPAGCGDRQRDIHCGRREVAKGEKRRKEESGARARFGQSPSHDGGAQTATELCGIPSYDGQRHSLLHSFPQKWRRYCDGHEECVDAQRVRQTVLRADRHFLGRCLDGAQSVDDTEGRHVGISQRNTSVVQPWVTNMTFSGVIGCRSVRRVKRQTAVMEAIAKFSESHKHPNFSISMRSTFFPGAYLKHAKMRGVINVFRNGSYVIVGVRSQEEANELRDWLDVIMKEYWMTLKRGSPCACFVDSSSATASAAAVERELLEEFGLAESGPATEGQIGETKEEAEEEEVVVDKFLELDEVTETDVLKGDLPQTRVGKVMVATEMGRTQFGICGTSRRQEWLKTPYSTKYYDY
jgi:hypothetical protein